MNDEVAADTTAVVTAADIARLAGVTRAAVSNWRRRYEDFPAPTAGTAASPLFALPDVRDWLERQRKGQDISREVRLWQALRAAYGEDMVRALTAVGAHLAGERPDGRPGHGRKAGRAAGRKAGPGAARQKAGSGASGQQAGRAAPVALDRTLRAEVDALAAERAPRRLFADLITRYLASSGRAGTEAVSTRRLIRAVKHFAGTTSGTVCDPACGIGSLLLSVGGSKVRERAGQELDPYAARLVELRARLDGDTRTRVVAGDSLRENRLRDLRAELVVCEPPVGVADWGREDLLLDARWELGLPSRAEGELAWLQHCYAHAAPGGRVVVVMPASVAYRKAGRRIRAELVRRGVLTDVVALPSGVADAHALPLHLWILRRPATADGTAGSVRMTDLTDNDPDGSLRPRADQVAEVSLIDLLDDTVDLTPGRYVAATQPDYPAEYAATRDELEQRLRELADLLPDLPAGPGAGSLDGATVGVNDLARAGLVDLDGREPSSASDQLDTDYLRGFVRSGSNARRNTTASGTYRPDPRSARLPQMDIGRQRQYGAAFRTLSAFEKELKELGRMGDRVARLARDGLATGALGPEEAGQPEQPEQPGKTAEPERMAKATEAE